MIRRAALWLLMLLPLRYADGQAVPETRVEVGYAKVRQALDTARLATDAAIMSIFWRKPLDQFTVLASGNLTYGQDSIAAAQGVAAISLPWNFDERLLTEAGVAGAQFSLRGSGRGGNTNIFGRQHFVTDIGGGWLGGGLSSTRRDARSSYSSVTNVGAWGRFGFLYGSASYARQESNDFALLSASGGAIDPTANEYRLEDIEFVVEARGGPNSLALSWAKRRGIAGTDMETVAISSTGLLQLTDRFALTATAGKQLADPLRGLPEADVFTAAVRLSFGPKPLPVMQRSAIASATVERHPGGGGDLVVRVFAADTMFIEVAGDFSDWHPLPLVREDGFYVARVRLPSGKHRVAVRVNLGAWRAPRNLARIRDDFGGEAGIIVIP